MLPALFARMRAANPGLWNVHLHSTAPAPDGERSITDAIGLRYTEQTCWQSVCAGLYFDGRTLFDFDMNGTMLPRGDLSSGDLAQIRALRIVGTLDFLDPSFRARGGRITDRGWAAFDGAKTRCILVRDAHSAPVSVYIDPRTALIAGVRDESGDRFSLRDYRSVERWRLPFEIDRNGKVLDRYLSRSIGVQPLTLPEPLQPHIEAFPAGMPLDIDSTAPIGSCTLNGVRARCLVDTGNSGLGISADFAKRLGLASIGMVQVAGLGSYDAPVVRAGPLEMGNVRFPSADYAVLNDIHNFGYDLVLGADVFAASRITLDFSRHGLFFDAPATEPATSIPLTFTQFVPVVNVWLDQAPARLTVDTGDQSGINLTAAYHLRHPNLFAVSDSRTVAGIGGTSTEILGTIGQVRIGALLARTQEIGATKTLRTDADGHLGSGFLYQYRMLFDYAHARLLLTPLLSAVPRPVP